MSTWDAGLFDTAIWSGTRPPLGLQYLVAFQNNQFDDPALITSVASPAGTLGATNVWTDVTRWVRDDSGDRGRQHELTQFEAGTRQITLRNDDGRFTPWNASSPYTGFLTIRKPFQVRVTWSGVTYARFTGLVDSWGVSWPDATQQEVVLHATDAFRMFEAMDITSTGYAEQVAADGAVAFWRLNDPQDATFAADSIGSHDGRLANGPVFGVPGPLVGDSETGVQLGTASTYGAFIATGSVLNLASNLSIEAWVQMPAIPPNLSIVVNQQGATGNVFGFGLCVVPTVGWPQMLGPSAVCGGSINICDGQWHHLLGTCTSTGNASLYVDGVLNGTQTGMGTTTAVAGTLGVLYGNVANVALYPTVLTAAQAANHYGFGSAFPQESSDARVGDVLDAVGWSPTARDLDAGNATVQAVTSPLSGTSALSHMQSCEGTEGGALFMTGDGQVRFMSRSTFLSDPALTASQVTFGDDTAVGDIPFQAAPTLAVDDVDLYNEAVAARDGGNTQIARDQTSIDEYGRVTWQPPVQLIGTSDADVLSLCQYIIVKYAEPVPRLAAITVDVTSVIASFPTAVPALLELDVLYRVTVARTLMPGGGTAFTQVSNIEHITETINAQDGTWTLTFGMAIADPAWWVLGTSELGVNNALAY